MIPQPFQFSFWISDLQEIEFRSCEKSADVRLDMLYHPSFVLPHQHHLFFLIGEEELFILCEMYYT